MAMGTIMSTRRYEGVDDDCCEAQPPTHPPLSQRQFVEISEQILNDMLSNLGGSLEDLEKALDEAASVAATGPRDDARKRMVDNLLTFDSFPHFCTMMEAKVRPIPLCLVLHHIKAFPPLILRFAPLLGSSC